VFCLADESQASPSKAQAIQAQPNIPHLDLDAAFAGRSLTTDMLAGGNANGHWNAFGHAQTARSETRCHNPTAVA
jgi:hypothetical protein